MNVYQHENTFPGKRFFYLRMMIVFMLNSYKNCMHEGELVGLEK